jgi:hypothetical protein
MEAHSMRRTHIKDLLNFMKQEGVVSFDLPARAKKPQSDTIVKAA